MQLHSTTYSPRFLWQADHVKRPIGQSSPESLRFEYLRPRSSFRSRSQDISAVWAFTSLALLTTNLVGGSILLAMSRGAFRVFAYLLSEALDS